MMASKKAAPIEPPQPPDRAAQLVWFDPGTTTGLVVVSLDADWLEGEGSGMPVGFKRALFTVTHYQLGKKPRGDNELVHASDTAVDEMERVDARLDWLWELDAVEAGLGVLHELPFAAWGYEDFRVRELNQDETFLSPARIGASLRNIMLRSTPSRAPFMQSSQLGLNPDNDRMQAAGLYKRGMPHATDAARHAFTFYRRARQTEALRAEAWPHLFGGK